jgi:hypothetical protein
MPSRMRSHWKVGVENGEKNEVRSKHWLLQVPLPMGNVEDVVVLKKHESRGQAVHNY